MVKVGKAKKRKLNENWG